MSIDVQKLREELEQDEGIRRRPYDDFTGKEIKRGDTIKGLVTIGLGRNLSEVGIFDDELELMFVNNCKKFAADLDARLSWWRELDDVRARALFNMVFNLGIVRLSGFGKMLTALHNKDWQLAAKEAKESKWAVQVQESRVERIVTMFLTGEEPE